MAIAVNEVLDVADGARPGQFEVGDRRKVQSLSDLDPVYRQLLDGPVTAVVSVIGSTGLSNLSPVWFDYDGDLVFLNMASHRKKVNWLRNNPHATFLLMNPENAYHWLSIKARRARGLRGRPAGGSARHRPHRQDVGQVHPDARWLLPARPEPRRAAHPIRAPCGLGRHVRPPLTELSSAWALPVVVRCRGRRRP
jgi:hypothetical protein